MPLPYTSMGMLGNWFPIIKILWTSAADVAAARVNWWCSPLTFDLLPCTFSRVGIYMQRYNSESGRHFCIFYSSNARARDVGNENQPTSIINIEWIQRQFSRSGAFGCIYRHIHTVGSTRDQFGIKDTHQVYQHQSRPGRHQIFL